MPGLQIFNTIIALFSTFLYSICILFITAWHFQVLASFNHDAIDPNRTVLGLALINGLTNLIEKYHRDGFKLSEKGTFVFLI